MRLREVRIEGDGALGGRQAIVALPPMVKPQASLRAGHQRPRVRIVRVDLGGALAEANHRFASAGIADIARDAVLPRHQIELVRLGIAGPTLLDRLLLLGQELKLQRLDDGLEISSCNAKMSLRSRS